MKMTLKHSLAMTGVVTGLVFLTACGGGSQETRTTAPCPIPAVFNALSDVTRYAPPASNRPDDLAWQGRVRVAGISCSYGVDQKVHATLGLGTDVTPGPRATEMQTPTYFVALVNQQGQVLSRQVFTPEVDPDKDWRQSKLVEFEMALPDNPQNLKIYSGWEKSKAELAQEKQLPQPKTSLVPGPPVPVGY